MLTSVDPPKFPDNYHVPGLRGWRFTGPETGSQKFRTLGIEGLILVVDPGARGFIDST